eukprot:TRINITY_DN16915_c0_g1_i2.p1 TRINITY_DN16915_c0_g1~~TRINITY_DN16915_c0_g1_i2.p1  ORF type:complete len:257 (+),score=55.99 TRINITY_DN16915_c0_g1_i2:73-843(+)
MCIRDRLDIKPSSVFYNKDANLLKVMSMEGVSQKTEGLKSIEGKTGAITPAYAPPEVLRIQRGLSKVPNIRISSYGVDVYCWAMTFYSLMLNRDNEELERECVKYKLGTERGYKKFTELVREKLDSVKAGGKVEELAKKILLPALEYRPSDRPTMGKIVNEIQNFEQVKGEESRHEEDKTSDAKNGMEPLPLNSDSHTELKAHIPQRSLQCFDCERSISFKAMQICGHALCKYLSLIHICRCRRYAVCRSRWSPYH